MIILVCNASSRASEGPFLASWGTRYTTWGTDISADKTAIHTMFFKPVTWHSMFLWKGRLRKKEEGSFYVKISSAHVFWLANRKLRFSFHLSVFSIRTLLGADKATQWSRVLAALTEHWRPVPSTRIRLLTTVWNPQDPFWTPWALHTHTHWKFITYKCIMK